VRPSTRVDLVERVDDVAGALSAERLDRRQVHLRKHAQHQPHVGLLQMLR
jgi:hypothetical protein